MTTALIVLYLTVFTLSFTTALGSEVSHRSHAAMVLTVWSLVLLTGIVIADRVVDL